MISNVAKTGYVLWNELCCCPGVPSEARMEQGSVAVIECVQEIPCNPCQFACPHGAITVGDNITNLPQLDENKCIGCGLCISQCPGLAIFVVNKAHAKQTATVAFPYEYVPVPKPGQTVQAVNRQGMVVCDAKVISAKSPKAFNHTTIVSVEIPKEYANEVRSIKREVSVNG